MVPTGAILQSTAPTHRLPRVSAREKLRERIAELADLAGVEMLVSS
jgi:hypothetical protein